MRNFLRVFWCSVRISCWLEDTAVALKRSKMYYYWGNSEIEKCILQSDLSLVPNNDGSAIRISIPILTEERRKELVKLVGRRLENSRIAVRNIRREGVDQIKKLENSKQLSSDDSRVAQQEIQKITDSNIQQLETLAKDKEREVMEV